MAVQSMYRHYLEPKKGWNANMNALDFQGKIADTVTFEVPWGRVMHLNDDGELVTGAHVTGMALFLWPGQGSLNVSNPGGSYADEFIHMAVAPAGNIGSLVAGGAYEFASSEFDDTVDYLPNDLLTALPDDDDIDVGGLLTNEVSGQPVEQYEDPVVGVVSMGVIKNHFGVRQLHFWPRWLPGAAA